MSTVSETPPVVRLSTGSTELDQILDGGFPTNSINLILGEPGTGKTILVERLMFANANGAAQDKRPIVYLTTLSEPADKVVRYLQQFDFYDADALTRGDVLYDSVAEELAADGVGVLPERLRTLIMTHSPKIIVIDSFKAVHDLTDSMSEMRRMLYQLSGLLTAYETTAFLVGEYEDAMIAKYPEFAVADSMVQLTRQRHTDRDERYLRVLKLRGSNYQEGLHAYRISGSGLDVYPRLRTPALPGSYATSDTRVPFGVAGIDAMLRGGLWRGTTTLIKGDSGSGKTTLGLEFALEGLRRGEQVVYVNFQENPTQLGRAIRRLGLDVEAPEARGLHLLYASPVELQIDSIVVELFAKLDAYEVSRVVIDAVGDLLGEGREPRLFGYLYTLSQHFVERGVTSVMNLETYRGEHPLSTRMSAMCDNILSVSVCVDGDNRQRMLEIVKARGTEHEMSPRELKLVAAGAEVA